MHSDLNVLQETPWAKICHDVDRGVFILRDLRNGRVWTHVTSEGAWTQFEAINNAARRRDTLNKQRNAARVGYGDW